MRSFLAVAVASVTALAAAVTTAPSAHAQEGGSLVVGIFGGETGDFLRGIIDAFAAEHGAEVSYVEGTAAQLLARAVAQKSNQELDVIVANDQTFPTLKSEDVAEPLNPEIVTELDSVLPSFRDADGYGQAFGSSPVGLQYRTPEIAANNIDLSSWGNLSDEALAGKIILQSPPSSYGTIFIVALNQQAGGDMSDLTPAYEALKALAPNVLTSVRSPGQAEDLISRGEGWVTIASASRAAQLAAQGAPTAFIVPKEGTILNMNFLVPLKGSENADLAQELVNHFITAPIQQEIADELLRIPVRDGIVPNAGAQEVLGYTDGVAPLGWEIDPERINELLPEMVDNWNRILSTQ